MPVAQPSPDRRTVRRQISLPLSKAVEIALKSITLRLGRSLVVTSGIVLAMAFLMAVLTGEAMLRAMADWAQSWNAAQSEEYRRIHSLRLEAEARAADAAGVLRAAAETAPAASGAKRFDPRRAGGVDLVAAKEELRALPGAIDALAAAIAARPELAATMKQWIDDQRRAAALAKLLSRGDDIRALMQAAGANPDPAAARQRAVRARWVAGLAVLVAFVGILNAMLMSVTERFREIGTMKCLGALDGFIVKLFLIESLFQGAAGTLIGVVAGFALAAGGMYLTYGEYAWLDFQAAATLRAAGICILIGVWLTVAAAVLPAWQAAKMQPIEAMRAET